MRPDICFAVNTLRHVQLMVAKATVDYGLKYEANQKINLEGYGRKSTSGCCFSMGSSVIFWFSRKQSYLTPSIAEVEYVVACLASCEAV